MVKSLMAVNRQGNYISKTERQCTNCRAFFALTSKTVTLCNTCNSTRVKTESAENKMLHRARGRVKSRGGECSLTIEDIVIPVRCPVLDIPLVCSSGKSGGQYNSPSLDRIDNSLGYHKGNVQVISQLANAMKASATPEQLLKFADWVYATYGKNSEGKVTHTFEHED